MKPVLMETDRWERRSEPGNEVGGILQGQQRNSLHHQGWGGSYSGEVELEPWESVTSRALKIMSCCSSSKSCTVTDHCTSRAKLYPPHQKEVADKLTCDDQSP